MGKKPTINLDAVRSTAAGDLAGMPDPKEVRSQQERVEEQKRAIQQ